jgi:hypothetical protein
MRSDRSSSPQRHLPGRARLSCALAILTLGLAALSTAAPAALAASAANDSNAFNELTSGGQPSTPTTTTTSESSSESSNTNSKTLVFGALGLAVVLLVGIAYVIARDARRVAPAGEAHGGESAFTRDPAAQLRKRRAKAKAARRQRKRNR